MLNEKPISSIDLAVWTDNTTLFLDKNNNRLQSSNVSIAIILDLYDVYCVIVDIVAKE